MTIEIKIINYIGLTMKEIEVGENFLVKIENDILIITVKPDIYVELEMVQEVVAKQREILEDKAILVLLNISESSGISKEAREYTSGRHVEGLQIAMAILISSLPMRLMANFFIKFDKPPAPTRLFNSYNEAINWLETYR